MVNYQKPNLLYIKWAKCWFVNKCKSQLWNITTETNFCDNQLSNWITRWSVLRVQYLKIGWTDFDQIWYATISQGIHLQSLFKYRETVSQPKHKIIIYSQSTPTILIHFASQKKVLVTKTLQIFRCTSKEIV